MTTKSEQYNKEMSRLGEYLGSIIKPKLNPRKPFVLVTNPQDADFLARGILSELPKAKARLVCYWIQRYGWEDCNVTTVVRSFVDPSTPKTVDTAIIAKCAITNSSVLKTNIEELLTTTKPQRIIVAAPVMFKGVEEDLFNEIPAYLANRIELVYFTTSHLNNTPDVRLYNNNPNLVKEWMKK